MCLCVVKFCFCQWRWCCVFGLFVFCLSFDGTGGHMVRLKRENLHDLQKYLADFGYMERSKDGAFALRTEESVLDALKELQDFAGLPPSGKLDGPTRRLLRTPRCGLPDKDGRSPLAHNSRRKRFTIHGPKWPYTSLTWSLRSKNVGNLDQYQVRFVISKALEVWSKHSQLTFTEVDSDKADIIIYFYRGDHGDNFPFDGRGLVLAHAFFPTGMRSSIEVHFDADEAWTTTGNSEQGTNLFNVAAHEIGHSLGLSHSKVESALMYPWYKEMDNGFDYELPDDDKQAIQFLYGARDDRRVWMKMPEYRPIPTTTTTTSTTTTTTSTTTSRPRIYQTRQPQQPYDPRYPHGRHPFPYHPQKPSYYPQKPMHPDKKPHYPKHSGEQYPYGPDRKHPHHKHIPERTPDKVYPTRGYPTNNPDKYLPQHPPIQHYPKSNPNPPKESPTKKSPPDTCDTSYDAVAVIRREVFIFKDAYFWRIGESGLMKGYPAEIRRLWHGLPYNLTNVDAVYERTDGKIVFFVGDLYYVFSNNNVERGYPKSLTNLGLTEDVKKIDGAMVWGHNGKTYFYSGDMYWRFDEDIQKVELDYPRRMSMWKGVGTDIDAVFQWKDGKTYFFKGKGFWKFNDLHMRVEHIEPKLSAPFWMGCSTNYEENDVGHKLPYTHVAYSNASFNTFSTLLVTILIIFYNLRLTS